MTFTTQFIAAMPLTLFAVTSYAGNESGKGCKPLGSWLGYDANGSVW